MTPILLVELIFPAHRDEKWLGHRGMVGLSLLLLADVVFGSFLLTPYRPPLYLHLLAVAITALVLVFARRLPVLTAGARPARVPPPLWFALLGSAAATGFFFVVWGLPELSLPVLM